MDITEPNGKREEFVKTLQWLLADVMEDIKKQRTTKKNARNEEREVKQLFRLAGLGDPTPQELERILEC